VSATIDLARYSDAFARVCADNPTLGISGHKCPWVPGPFTAADVDTYAPMFAQCVSWIRAFHKAAPGVNVESDLARDAMHAWRQLHGDMTHINLGVFTAGAIHLGIAGARRRGRPDVYINLRLATVLMALDTWTAPGHDTDGLHPAIELVEQALRAARL
jgi:hypothetical protein